MPALLGYGCLGVALISLGLWQARKDRPIWWVFSGIGAFCLFAALVGAWILPY